MSHAVDRTSTRAALMAFMGAAASSPSIAAACFAPQELPPRVNPDFVSAFTQAYDGPLGSLHGAITLAVVLAALAAAAWRLRLLWGRRGDPEAPLTAGPRRGLLAAFSVKWAASALSMTWVVVNTRTVSSCENLPLITFEPALMVLGVFGAAHVAGLIFQRYVLGRVYTYSWHVKGYVAWAILLVGIWFFCAQFQYGPPSPFAPSTSPEVVF